jgi:hypothetical protein
MILRLPFLGSTGRHRAQYIGIVPIITTLVPSWGTTGCRRLNNQASNTAFLHPPPGLCQNKPVEPGTHLARVARRRLSSISKTTTRIQNKLRAEASLQLLEFRVFRNAAGYSPGESHPSRSEAKPAAAAAQDRSGLGDNRWYLASLTPMRPTIGSPSWNTPASTARGVE